MIILDEKTKSIRLDAPITWERLYSDLKVMWKNSSYIRYPFPLRGIHTTRFDIHDWSIKNAHFLTHGGWISYYNDREIGRYSNFQFVGSGDLSKIIKKICVNGDGYWISTKRNWINTQITNHPIKFIFVDSETGGKGFYEIRNPYVGSFIVPAAVSNYPIVDNIPHSISHLDDDLFEI